MKCGTACGLLLGLAACRHLPEVSSPVTDLPAPLSWQALPLNPAEQVASDKLASWWELFEDEEMTLLVEAALEANLDLQRAFERIEEAAALRGVAAGGRWPAANASASVQETRLSDAQGGVGGDRNVTLTAVGLDASWELDLFGRVRFGLQAAEAGMQLRVEEARGVRALVAAQVVDAVILLREVRLRQSLARENIARQQETLQLTQGRFDSGLVPQLDVHQAELNLARTEAVLPRLRQSETTALRRLDVLLGMMPGEAAAGLNAEAMVPLPEPVRLQDLPVNVLRRRPDLRVAEQGLLAAAAEVGVAEASLYPRISLSGQFAWQAQSTGELFSGGSLGSALGPRIVWPFFQGGRLRAQLQAAESRVLQAELGYRQGVLQALAEVENALTAYREEWLRREKLAAGVEAATISVTQVRSLYENGLVTFLNVLDAERNLATLQDEAAASLGQTARNLSAVCRAMGGGWELPQATKIAMDLSRLDERGLRGPEDGKVAVHYEFVIPDTPRHREEVAAIDPTIQFMPGSRGRIGAEEGECLCVGSTAQENPRDTLQTLAELPYVERIMECVFE